MFLTGDGMIMTTVSGRPLQKMESRNNNPLKSYKPWFDKGDIIVDAEITYRPLATLQMMKLVEYYPQPPLAVSKTFLLLTIKMDDSYVIYLVDQCVNATGLSTEKK